MKNMNKAFKYRFKFCKMLTSKWRPIKPSYQRFHLIHRTANILQYLRFEFGLIGVFQLSAQ